MSSKRQIKNLEAERSETLSEIRDERDAFESMLQRARIAKMTPANEFLADVFARFEKIEQAAQTAQNIDEISQAGYDADTQGQLRAYLCPLDEIEDEGNALSQRVKLCLLAKPASVSLRSVFAHGEPVALAAAIPLNVIRALFVPLFSAIDPNHIRLDATIRRHGNRAVPQTCLCKNSFCKVDWIHALDTSTIGIITGISMF